MPHTWPRRRNPGNEEWGWLKMRRRTKIAGVVVIVLAAPFILGYVRWRHQYPYGFSHCCDLILYSALEQYAATHGGAFPSGEATPEASLSLLYREPADWTANADLLRGKTVPESVVREILERGELLTPDTCGWHYVEGLRKDDDPRLALFWDKVGLDHNGGRLAEGGHVVVFVDGQRKHIPEVEWNAFIEEQCKLLAERKAAIHHDAKVRIDNNEIWVQVRVVDDCIYGSTRNSRMPVATTAKQELGLQGLPVIPIDEIRNATVVVEQNNARVRFVLHGREIVYDRSGFHVVTTSHDQSKD